MEVESVIKRRDRTLKLFICTLMPKRSGLRIEVLCFVTGFSMDSISILLHLLLSCCGILSNLFVYFLNLVFTRCWQRPLSFVVEIFKIGLILKIDGGGIRSLSIFDFIFDRSLYSFKKGIYLRIQDLIYSFDLDAVIGSNKTLTTNCSLSFFSFNYFFLAKEGKWSEDAQLDGLIDRSIVIKMFEICIGKVLIVMFFPRSHKLAAIHVKFIRIIKE